MKPRPISHCHHGSALITTLLVIVVLTIIVTAFLQSMTIEKKTAHSYLNRYRAELALNAGKNSAIQLLKENFTRFPDSVTWWDPDLAAQKVSGTVLSYYATEASTDATRVTPENSFYLPLVSGATVKKTADKASTISLTGDEPDLNSSENASLVENGQPWMGSVSGVPAPVVKVPWVYLKDNAGKRLSRYAFWIEDESFRVNINIAGNEPRDDDTEGKNPSEIPLQGAFVAAGLEKGEATSFAGSVIDLRSTLGATAADKKFFGSSEISYAISPPNRDNYEKSRFILTDVSNSSNLSRTGARRLNLNALNAAATPAKNSQQEIQEDIDKIKAAINFSPDTSATEETEKFKFGGRFYRTTATVSNTSNVPNTNSEPFREIYVTKIAANIRDYIDADSSSTNVLDDGTVSLTKPTQPVGGAVTSFEAAPDNDYWAIGKENVPRITKTMVHVEQFPTQMSANTNYVDSTMSYYIEVWNLGTKDIIIGSTVDQKGTDTETVLDPSTFIQIGNQPGWIDTAPIGGLVIVQPDTIASDRIRTIPLKEFQNTTGETVHFPAGELTVLTTDPRYNTTIGNTSPIGYLTIPPASVYYASGHEEHLKGPLAARRVSSDKYGGNRTLDCDLRPSRQSFPTDTPKWDNQTYVFIGNNTSMLDSQRAAVPIQPGIFIDAFGQKNNRPTMHFRGGTLPGNLPTAYDMPGGGYPSQTGDPRASTDTLIFDSAGGAVNTSMPTYAHAFPSWRDASSQSANTYTRYSVLGYMQASGNLRKVNNTRPALNPFISANSPKNWDDAGSSFNLSARDALTTTKPGSIFEIANEKMTSIGELGKIYDPAYTSSDSTHIKNSRGGGRTLRIGQSEKPRFDNDPAAQWDGEENSASRTRVAWRLCDIFSTTSDLSLEGLINPNGVQRDGGAALRAALFDFKFSGKSGTQTDSSIDGKSLASEDNYEGKALIDSLIDYIKLHGPLRERGELSELALFNSGKTLANVDMSQQSDLAREQLFGRLIELTTTRGNTFTIYLVGQSLFDNNSATTPKVLSSVKRKITIRLIPRFASSDLNDLTVEPDFDPTVEDQVKNRFAKPTYYDVEILRDTP